MKLNFNGLTPSLARKYKTTVEVENALGYYNMAEIMAIKSFIVQAPGSNLIKLSSSFAINKFS